MIGKPLASRAAKVAALARCPGLLDHFPHVPVGTRLPRRHEPDAFRVRRRWQMAVCELRRSDLVARTTWTGDVAIPQLVALARRQIETSSTS
jgi:hypothetical protein